MAKTRKRNREENGPADQPAATPQLTGNTTAAQPERERIAARAYELYLARGASEGREMDDWLEAERELSQPGHRREPE